MIYVTKIINVWDESNKSFIDTFRNFIAQKNMIHHIKNLIFYNILVMLEE